MDKQYIIKVVETIRQQLLAFTPLNVIYSWGVTGFYATTVEDMPTLMFRVNGRLFKGNVLVAYNSSDLYDIYLRNENGLRMITDECCYNEIGSIVDEAIEKGTDDEEYQQFVEGEYFKLIGKDIEQID